MEEHVGQVWHKFITNSARQDYPDKAVYLDDVAKEITLLFKALGGDPAIRVDACQPQKLHTQRSIVQKVAGSGLKIPLTWTDDESIRLPERIAQFDDSHLNHELYLWLAALCACQTHEITDWFTDNQHLTQRVLIELPGLKGRYQRLVSAHLEQRPKNANQKDIQREEAIQNALITPGSETVLPELKYPPNHVPLWLYQGPPGVAVHRPIDDNDSDNDGEAGNSKKPKKKEEKKQRKRAERVDEPNGR